MNWLGITKGLVTTWFCLLIFTPLFCKSVCCFLPTWSKLFTASSIIFLSFLVKILSASIGVLFLIFFNTPPNPSIEPLKAVPKAPPKPILAKYSSRLTSSPNKSLTKVSPVAKPAPCKAAFLSPPFPIFAVEPAGITWNKPADKASAWLISLTPLNFCACIFV